tara:strand:- start:81 stop:323 length:243 start_codon:yes stop_codon:yes gene_type:complete
MKKYIALFGAISVALFSSSCKKDFVCECTSTNSTSTVANVSTTTVKDATKKQAKAQCISTEDTWTYNGTTIVLNNTCELK